MRTKEELIREVEDRNKFRAEVGLPQVSLTEEVKNLEELERFEAFLEAKGRNDPKLGFFGNRARYNHLEEEFRQLLKEEWAGGAFGAI